ncbi:MAG: transglycosylase SLT domain-containing protein [Chitinophagales bacterium]
MPNTFAQTDSLKTSESAPSEKTDKVFTGNISFSSDPNMNVQPPPETHIPSRSHQQSNYTPSQTYVGSSNLGINNPFQYYSDEHYRSRINNLAQNCQLPITYNKYVRTFIEVYTHRKRDVSSRILGKVNIYFPIIEKIFLEEGVPLDLKYLAATESALNQHAVSRAGAVGLWQFMPATGRENGLTVNSYVDERIDPYKATKAAARFFKKLHRKYSDWFLVIAAYNCGPGNVNKAMRRTGGHNYWTIRRALPRETRGYVPSYIACVYFINYYYDHYLEAEYPPYGTAYANAETIPVYGPLNIQSVADATGANLFELEHLNASMKKRYLPAGQRFDFRIPYSHVAAFHASRGTLNNTQIAYGTNATVMPASSVSSGSRIAPATYNSGYVDVQTDPRISPAYTKAEDGTMVPVRGATSSVYNNASSYNSNASTASAYNTSSTANAYTPSASAYEPAPVRKAAPKPATSSKKKLTYTVKKGDNIGFISEWYDCGASKVRSWNRISNNIRAGQKLVIYKDKKVAHKYADVNTMTFAEKQKFASTGVSPSSTRVARSASSGDNVKKYKIKRGDSLWSIAQRNPGNTIDALRKLNKLGRSHKLMPGALLKIYTP